MIGRHGGRRGDAPGARAAAALVAWGVGLAAAAGADAAPPPDPPIATDRPGNGNAATTVPAVRLQAEGGLLYAFDAREGPDAHLFTGQLSLRLGVVDGLELRAGTGVVGFDLARRPEGARGPRAWAADLFVGTKAQVLRGGGARPDLALMVDVFLPTGGGPFTAGAVVPEPRVAAAWALPAGWGLLLNAGADVPEDARGRFARALFVANVGVAPPGVADGRLALFVEAFGRVPFDGAREAVLQIDWGAALRLTDDLQLDVFAQHALTAASPDLQVALGLSGRL